MKAFSEALAIFTLVVDSMVAADYFLPFERCWLEPRSSAAFILHSDIIQGGKVYTCRMDLDYRQVYTSRDPRGYISAAIKSAFDNLREKWKASDGSR